MYGVRRGESATEKLWELVPVVGVRNIVRGS